MNVTQQIFGQLNGKNVYRYTLANDHGFQVACLNYGCIITDILAPDAAGNVENVVLGFDDLNDYLQYSPYFGAVVGRFAGRIKNGEFELDGVTHRLTKNENGNQLHGGVTGFDKVIWDARLIEESEQVGVQFTYLSPDGAEGYPGNLEVNVTYLVNNENELIMTYEGKTDKTTLLNMTNHSYFNLSGHLKRDVQDHLLTLKSDQFLELQENLLPTGKRLDVANTPFDFQNGRKIKTGVQADHIQNIIAGQGYDHPFILKANHDKEIVLVDEASGRSLEIETDEKAVVVYTGNHLCNDFSIRGVPSGPYMGICLETQGYPDSVHHDHFPAKILDEDQLYSSKTTYRFGTS